MLWISSAAKSLHDSRGCWPIGLYLLVIFGFATGGSGSHGFQLYTYVCRYSATTYLPAGVCVPSRDPGLTDWLLVDR